MVGYTRSFGAGQADVWLIKVAPAQHKLTIEASGSGTTNPTPGIHTYDEGETVTVDAQPNSGYKLDHWLLDNVNIGSTDPYPVTIDANHTLRAIFVVITSPPDGEPQPPTQQPPTASFTCPSTSTAGQTVSFDASASYDPDGNIRTYAWNFGDDSSGSGKTTSHTYEAAGTYTVTLTVTDNDGQKDTYDRNITVEARGDVDPPVADVQTDNKNVKTGATVTFNGGGSSDNVGVVSYEWDFGDGTTGTGAVAIHTYADAGTYNVILTVKDAAENSNAATFQMIVDGAAAAAAPFPFWILIPVIAAIAGGAGSLLYLKRRKPKEKPPKPSAVRVTAEPTELPADGKSKSTVTVELLDAEGKLMQAPDDIEVKLSSTMGKVESPVVVPKGKAEEKTFLISSKEFGTVKVSADAKGLKSIGLTLSFLEKKRYCMHCGARISLEDKRCPECNEPPPSAPDTFKCKNCGEVLPLSVKTRFCRECGASQPKEKT
jgi:PKD repeat protein